MILRNSTQNKKPLQHLDKQLESPQSPDAIYHLPPLTPYPSVDPSYIPHKAARMIKYVSMTEKEEDVRVENNGMRKMNRNDHLNSLLISQYQQELPENPKRNLSIDSQGKGQRGFLTGFAAVRSRQTEFLEDGTFGDNEIKNEQNLVRNRNRGNEEQFDVEETRELGVRWQEKANKLGGFYRNSKWENQAKESESNSEGSEEMQIETRKENKKERGVRPRRSYSKYDEIEEEEDIEEVKSKKTFRRKNVDRYEEEQDKDDYGYEQSDNPSGDDLDLGYSNQRIGKNRSLLESRVNEVKTSDTEQEKVLFSGRIAKRVKRPSKENQDESLKNEESVLSTPMERFRAILEKNMQPSLHKIEGKCLSMTPLSKTRSHDLFEKERGTGIPKPEWFVKKYDRNAVNRDDPNQLRPLNVLRETIDYLVNNILDVEKKKSTKYALPRGLGRYCFDDIHNFLSSTLSSIRQDISLQGLSTERQAIELYEEIVRYHLIAINEGRDSENKNFDPNSNMDLLAEALASLKYAYNEARNMANKSYSLLKDQAGFEIKMLKQFEDKFYLSPNEPEFIAYDAVLQLDREINPADILKNINKYPEELLESKEVKFAVKVITAVKENNYTQYFKLLGEADYLTSCAMSASIKSIREKAIKSMVDSQTSTSIKKMSVNEFYELLAFEDYDEAMEFLRAYGLEEVSQGASIDDIQGSEDVVFKLKKVDIKDEKEKLEAKKRFAELKPAMNVRIIEIKRNIENFKGTYQREKDIHFDNTQVSRRFIVRGTWKKEDTEYSGKLLKSIETGKCKEILSEKEIISNKMRSSKESPMRVTEVSKKKDGKGLSPKEFKKLEEELEKARKKEMQEEEEQKELKKVQHNSINKMFKLLNTVLAWNKKELLMTLEADLEYEREFKTFRAKILEKNKSVPRGITNQKLKPTNTLKKSGFTVGDWDEYSFFGFLADALSEQEPELERYCYKAVVFHPLYRDIHFELFKYLVDFLTDSRENLEQLEFDQLPLLYESQNIHFESEGVEKKLWVSFKVFDENYRAEGYIDEDRMSEESGSEASEERHHVVPAVDISSSNLVIFVLTGNKKLDKKRFEPIYNAVNEKKHLDNTNILFLQMYELSEHKPAEKIRKHEIIEMFNLDKIETKGIQLHFIKVPYVHSTDIENNRFFFKDIEYVLKDKVTAVVKTGIDERVYTKLPSFYTLKDLTEKLRNSLEDLRALSIDYESTGIEVKAQILHEIMSSNSIEAYYYVKNFINHAVNSIKVNFDYWYENIDRIVPEFLENYNEQALDKIKNGKAEFDAILEKMLKINDFDERYWKFLKAGNKLILNADTVYGLIERKVDRVFTSRKRQIKLDEVVEILENDFKFSAIGIKGAWKQLFRIVYKYYIQFLADLQPICILLDEDFKLNVNIDDLYKDVEEDIKKYNSWIEKLEFHNYEPPVNVVKKTEKMHSSLLRKRPYDAFYASESSIFPKDETMMDNISDLESSIMIREGLLHNMGVDWDFDKQYQTLKRAHVDDGNFLYKITEDHTE